MQPSCEHHWARQLTGARRWQPASLLPHNTLPAGGATPSSVMASMNLHQQDHHESMWEVLRQSSKRTNMAPAGHTCSTR